MVIYQRRWCLQFIVVTSQVPLSARNNILYPPNKMPPSPPILPAEHSSHKSHSVLWGHVGREVLIKLAPADRRDKLYQVVIRLDTTISTTLEYLYRNNKRGRRTQSSQLLPVRLPAGIFKLYWDRLLNLTGGCQLSLGPWSLLSPLLPQHKSMFSYLVSSAQYSHMYVTLLAA